MAHVEPVPLSRIEDTELLDCIQLMQERGTPRPEAFALFANNPDAAKGFFHYWRAIFHEGLVDHKIKELIRIKMAEIIGCTH